jgi:hypothetical protein
MDTDVSAVLKKIYAIQQAVGKITKDSKNDHFKNTYASLDAIMEFLQPHLEKESLQITHASDGEFVVTDVVDIESGDIYTSKLPLPTNCKPQDLGSAMTYYRRYNIVMMFNLLFDEDDDGNKASGYGKQQVQQRQTAVPAPVSHGDEKMCQKCGSEMIYKEGTTKAGKPYKAWMCASKDNTHTIWVN